MKRTGFEYRVSAVVEMNQREAEQILLACKRHYDLTVNRAGQRGGLAYGIVNRFALGMDATEVSLSADEIDLLVKALEEARDGDLELQSKLWLEMSMLLRDVIKEARRLRDEPRESV